MVKEHSFFEAINQLNILIIGDVMIDRYLSGSVDRISPEAPVPVVAFEREENRLGGAANVALNIRAMGANAFLCSVIGQDEQGKDFLHLLSDLNLDERGLLVSPHRRTTVKSRVLAAGQQLLRIDREDTHDLLEEESRNLLHKFLEIIDDQDIKLIIFQDYNKGVLSIPVIEAVIDAALKRGIPTAVDPKFRNFFAYRRVTLFKPNLKEVRAQTPWAGPANLEALNEASRQIRSRLQNTYTLITLSDKGLYFDAGDRQEIIPTQARSIADVCGAGDSVISIAALGLALGMDMRQIATLANLAGGQVCERVGVVPVDKQQLIREYAAIT